MSKAFIGTGVAVVTPFYRQGNVDFSAMERVLEHVIDKGVDYIVVLGSTGEASTLSLREQASVADFVVDTVNGRKPLVLGMSGNATQALIERIKDANLEGYDAILSAAPYYNKPGQKGIFSHFKNIASVSPVPIILYNVPGRTASNIAPETCLQLASEFENIIGIKEASGNMNQCMELLRRKPKDFLVISGEDALTVPLMSVGAAGVISVTANVLPGYVSRMVSCCRANKFQEAATIHHKLLPLTNTLFEEGNPVGVKTALEVLGLSSPFVRLPLVKGSKALSNKLTDLLADFSE